MAPLLSPLGKGLSPIYPFPLNVAHPFLKAYLIPHTINSFFLSFTECLADSRHFAENIVLSIQIFQSDWGDKS